MGFHHLIGVITGSSCRQKYLTMQPLFLVGTSCLLSDFSTATESYIVCSTKRIKCLKVHWGRNNYNDWARKWRHRCELWRHRCTQWPKKVPLKADLSWSKSFVALFWQGPIFSSDPKISESHPSAPVVLAPSFNIRPQLFESLIKTIRVFSKQNGHSVIYSAIS